MKQIARENLTTVDKLEIIKKGRFEVKSIKHGYSYTIKTIFKDKDGNEKFTSVQIPKRYLEFAFPLLEKRTFIPGKVIPDFLMVEGLFSKRIFFYRTCDRPHFTNKYAINSYQQALMKTLTTLNPYGYKLLTALKDFVEQEKIDNEKAP
jgi:hypothetical protein